jgi:O-antigen ligase
MEPGPAASRRPGGPLGYLLDGGLWGLWLGLSPLILFLEAPPRLPVWLYGTVDTRLETSESQLTTLALVVLGIVPAAATLLHSRARPAQALPIFALAMLILSIITLSLLGTDSAGDVAMPLLGLFVFGLAIVLASADVREDGFIRNMLVGYAVMHAVAALAAIIDGNFLYGRLMGRLGPNFWGSVCAYGLLAATVARQRWLFILLLAIDLVTLLLAQNRTAMFAAIAGGGLLILLAYRRAGLVGRLWMWLTGAATGIVLLFAMPLLLHKVFMIDDPRRGLDSGGTGRAEAWQQALDVFERNPLLGVGYRHHEHYITAASSAHQAYLATAADMGVIGLLAYLLFLAAGIGAGLYKAVVLRSQVHAALTAIIVGYAVQGFAEQRAINFANSISLMVLMAVALVTKVGVGPSLQPFRVLGRA